MEKYYRNPEIIDGELDDNQVMMHLKSGKYFGLNPVGKRIWELIEQPKTFEELVLLLLAEFEVSEPQCREELKSFLEGAVKNEVAISSEVD